MVRPVLLQDYFGAFSGTISSTTNSPHSEFSGRARNLIEFSCWDALASCTSNCSQIGVTPFFTPAILLYSKRVILLYSKRPHGTSIRSGEDATSRSINLASLILAADDPVMAKMIHSAIWDSERFVLKDRWPLHMVKLVGAVRNFCGNNKHVQINVEDGTRLVRVILWRNKRECMAQHRLLDKCNSNCYICVIGEVEDYYGVQISRCDGWLLL